MKASAFAAAAGRLPRLHAVTDDSVLRREDWFECASRALEAGGVDLALHLRGHDVGPRTLADLATRLQPLARSVGAMLVVNDRVDVALVTGVDGVHLGRRSLPPERVRDILGPDRWLGVSCHGPDEVGAASGGGADYVFVGTIHATPSHPGVAGVGATGLEEAVGRASGRPVIGIGGIGVEEVPAVVAAGGFGVAAIRGIWGVEDPAEAVTLYVERLKNQEAEAWKRRTRSASA